MHSKTSATRIKAALRRLEAIGLRREGLSYSEIGDGMSVSPGRAYALVKDALERMNTECTELAEEVLVLECERLDRIQYAHWAKAMSGDYKAARVVLAVMDRRARLLGLDAPEKREYTGDVRICTFEELIKRAVEQDGKVS